MHASHIVPRLAVLVITAGALACQTGRGATASSTTTTTSTSTSSTSTMPPAGGPAVQAASMEQAGEYLTIVGSCNDCHPGLGGDGGKVPPADRFAGLNVGFRGKWARSYGKNLRTVVQRQSEDHG